MQGVGYRFLPVVEWVSRELIAASSFVNVGTINMSDRFKYREGLCISQTWADENKRSKFS